MQSDILEGTVDRGIRLSRSSRALKVWESIQTFGMAASPRVVSKGIAVAAHVDEYVRASSILEILNPAQLSVVRFRINATDTEVDEEVFQETDRTVLSCVIGKALH